jgi:branched-subunit amino acid permease
MLLKNKTSGGVINRDYRTSDLLAAAQFAAVLIDSIKTSYITDATLSVGSGWQNYMDSDSSR